MKTPIPESTLASMHSRFAGTLRFGAVALALALGLSACQQTLEPGEDASLETELAANEEVSLRLDVKATEECLSLREALAAAPEAEKDSLHASFAELCVEKVRDFEGRDLPPLDDALRMHDELCRFVAVNVEASGDEVVVTYRKVCREEKDDGKDEEKGDLTAECGELRERIAKADLSEEDLAALKERFAKACSAPDPVVEINCEELRKRIAAADLSEDELAAFKERFAKACSAPDPVVEINCEELRKRIAAADLSEEDLAALKERFAKACSDPDPVVEVNCEELRKRIAAADLSEEDLAALKERFAKACSVPKPDPTVPAEECAAWLEKMGQMTPETDGYLELRRKIAAHCLEVLPPVEERPDPPVVEVDCEAALLHLEAYEAEHPDSKEAAARRASLAEICLDIQAP